MKVEVFTSVCFSCEATRIIVEKGVGAVAVASKAGLRGPMGTEVPDRDPAGQHGRLPSPILLLRLT
ncbi:hypothetical protein GCM10011583_31660 [Streptomyces camponoticapitis]|uniref:Uncharacterized protein n=1 Tax=Streptomyces camponoticapitis TaxID=1616125 RepID=A0ABQ2E6E3_9ACTN|nr:hypothetical protein GCM10011583_31660 [Streptomyces camponoticapitis]